MVGINRENHNVIVTTARWWKYVSLGLAFVLSVELLLFRRQAARDHGLPASCGKVSSFGSYKGHEYRNSQQTVGSPICLLESKWMKVQQHSVKPTSGHKSVITDWLWIDYHDRVNVLVEDAPDADGEKERRFLVFEQTKYALEGRKSLAVVGGIIEPGEDAQIAARREVAEEMGGMQCDDFIFLGRYRTDVNRGMGWVNSFLATQCSRSKEAGGIKRLAGTGGNEEVGSADTERQDLKSITLRELREAAMNGQFLEVQWSNTVSLALLRPEVMA